MNRAIARAAYLLLVLAICAFLCLPTVIVALASFSAGSIVTFPPQGFSLQWYANFLSRQDFIGSLLLSLSIALVTAVIATGVSAVVVVEAGRQGQLRRTIETLSVVPLMLPTIVYGPALLLVSGALGWLGSYWPTLLVLLGAHFIVVMPFTLRLMASAYAAVPEALEEAAVVAGAGYVRVFGRVILPSMSSALFAGGLFGFLVSFDEPVVSLFLSGQDLVTLPVQIQTYMRFRPDPTIAAVSTAMSVASFAAVLAVDRLFGLDRVFGLNR